MNRGFGEGKSSILSSMVQETSNVAPSVSYCTNHEGGPRVAVSLPLSTRFVSPAVFTECARKFFYPSFQNSPARNLDVRMPNPPPPPNNCFDSVSSTCGKVVMPDFADSFMTTSMNKVQCALDDPSAVGDGSDRNSTPLSNGIDHDGSANAGESLGEFGEGATAIVEEPEEENAYYAVKSLKTDFYETVSQKFFEFALFA